MYRTYEAYLDATLGPEILGWPQHCFNCGVLFDAPTAQTELCPDCANGDGPDAEED